MLFAAVSTSLPLCHRFFVRIFLFTTFVFSAFGFVIGRVLSKCKTHEILLLFFTFLVFANEICTHTKANAVRTHAFSRNCYFFAGILMTLGWLNVVHSFVRFYKMFKLKPKTITNKIGKQTDRSFIVDYSSYRVRVLLRSFRTNCIFLFFGFDWFEMIRQKKKKEKQKNQDKNTHANMTTTMSTACQ